MKHLNDSVQYIKGIGPRRFALLKKNGVERVFDLFWNAPRTYEDMNQVQSIGAALAGQALIRGTVTAVKSQRARRGIVLVKAAVEDETGSLEAIWFNQPFILDTVKTGSRILLKGKIKGESWDKQMSVAYYELVKDETERGLVPVYSLPEGMNQKTYRECMRGVLQAYREEYAELLPESLRDKWNLLPIAEAWQNLHFPIGWAAYHKARKRLALEELLLFRLLAYHTQERFAPREKSRPPLDFELVRRLTEILPYPLTNAQKKVIAEIKADMSKPVPMQRLLQGDVGSGKTVVAFMAMLMSIECGRQAIFMAPTEILAQQHYSGLKALAEQLGLVIALLTSSATGKERMSILEALKSGEIDLLIGTHALLQPDLEFAVLGMVVIDEQHRFGVKQRAFLSNHPDHPDILVMTATPIPRTLALALYGQLYVSVLDELPPGRQAVKTKFLSLNKRKSAYEFVRQEIAKGGQAYVVCPLVEESEKQDITNAAEVYQELQGWFGDAFRIGLVHGRMPAEEKRRAMEQFGAGQIDLLVATTVIEVGVDVPNATVILVEHAERFGLSQLHQLRGRAGRGSRQSYCILLGDPKSETAVKRLRAMEQSNDGFQLANLDLAIRGPGDMWGFKQHGLEELKLIQLDQDQALIAELSDLIDKIALELEPETWLPYLKIKFQNIDKIVLN